MAGGDALRIAAALPARVAALRPWLAGAHLLAALHADGVCCREPRGDGQSADADRLELRRELQGSCGWRALWGSARWP